MNIRAAASPSFRLWALAISAVVVGVTWQYLSLWLAERYVGAYPRVVDVVMDRLPPYSFGIYGELFFYGLVLLAVMPHFRYRSRETWRVLLVIGIFYFIRGIFTMFLPIGTPLGAVPPADRLDIYGFSTHSYFPGGHIGLLTILAKELKEKNLKP